MVGEKGRDQEQQPQGVRIPDEIIATPEDMAFELEKGRELEIGDFLKKLRVSKGKDVRFIAWKLEVGEKTISALEGGEFNSIKEKKGFTVRGIEKAYNMTDEEKGIFENILGLKEKVVKPQSGRAKAQLVETMRRKRERKAIDTEKQVAEGAAEKEKTFKRELQEELEKLKKGDAKMPAIGGSRSPGTADKEYHGERFEEDSMEDEDFKE